MRVTGVALAAALIAGPGCTSGGDTDAADASPTFRQVSDDALQYDQPISQVTDLLPPTAEGDPWRIVGSILDPGTGRSQAAVWTTTSPPDWDLTEVEPGNSHTSEAMAAITPFGDKLLAVGRVGDAEEADAAVWQADGDDWRRLDIPEMGGRHKQWAFDVAAGDSGVLVAGGESAWGDVRPSLWFSPDGETWTGVDGGPGGSLDATGEESVRAVSAFGAGFAAVGTRDLDGEQDGAAWFSPDGTTWEQMSVPTMGGEGRQSVLTVAAIGSTLVAGGYSANASGQGQPVIWTSTDGRTWSGAIPLPLQDSNRASASDLAVRSLSVTGTRITASGGSEWQPHMWDSGNGTSWALFPNPVRGDLFADGVGLVDAAAAPDGGVLALGDTPTVLEAAGNRWVDATGDTFPSGGNRPQATSVLLADDTLLAAGFNFTSAHGDHRERYTGRVWRRGGGTLQVVEPDDDHPDLEGGKINDVATFAGGYVAVGFEDFAFASQRTAQVGADLPDGILWTSEDGATWTRQAADVQSPNAQVLATGEGDPEQTAAAAVGLAAEQPRVSTGPAGGTGTRSLEAVVGLGNGFLAVGSVYGDNDSNGDTPQDTDALVVVSGDGATISGENANLKGPGTQRFRDVCRNDDGTVVAVGVSDGDVAVRRRAPDASWTAGEATDDSFGGAGHQEAFSCAAGEEGFIMVGTDDARGNTNARVWVSDDGASWHELTSSSLGGTGDQEASAVAEVPGDGWLVAGTDTTSGDHDVALWRVLNDGQITRRDRGEPSLSGPGDQLVESITVDGDHAVVVGQDQTGIGIWESRNLDR